MKTLVLSKTKIDPKEAWSFDSIEGEEYLLSPMPKGRKTNAPTLARFAYDGERLYVGFKAFFNGALSKRYSKKSGKVYRSDCVELFIAFEENFTQYLELDLSPYNKGFFARVSNEGVDAPPCEKWAGEGLSTYTKIGEGFYEAVYALRLKDFSATDSPLFVNLFRVEMIGNKRFSQALNPPDRKSHHVKSAFVKIDKGERK